MPQLGPIAEPVHDAPGLCQEVHHRVVLPCLAQPVQRPCEAMVQRRIALFPGMTKHDLGEHRGCRETGHVGSQLAAPVRRCELLERLKLPVRFHVEAEHALPKGTNAALPPGLAPPDASRHDAGHAQVPRVELEDRARLAVREGAKQDRRRRDQAH